MGEFSKKTIHQANLKGKTALIRVDFNVPVNNHGVITDDYRIRKALPTIEYARSKGAKVVLISHLGRPKSSLDKSASLKPVSSRLKDLLHLKVDFADDCVGPVADKAKKNLKDGDILLLENLRYHNEEEQNDDKFAKALAKNCDIFIQDGFGVVHRAHASTSAITKHLPSVAGVLLEKEVTTINNAIKDPKKPLAVVIGGAKISDKIDLLNVFIDKADFVAVVGAMANTFLLADGVPIGSSLVEKDAVNDAKAILKKANTKAQKQAFTFYLPHDVVVSAGKDSKYPTRIVDVNQRTWADIVSYPKKAHKKDYTVADNEWILDIGPMSAAYIAGAMSMAKTAIWNGTAGITEVKGIHGAANPYRHGTNIIAEALTGEHSGQKNIPFTIVGGGDTVGFVESVPGLREQLNHVSTGGGASLELMIGRKLPGVEALEDAN